MYIFLQLLFLLAMSLQAQEVIKENIAQAHAGDWLVMSFNKNFSFYKVLDNNGYVLHLEETCIAVPTFRRMGLSWKDWASKGYPGGASKMIYRIDIPKGLIQSSSNQDFCTPSTHGNAFLSTLINLRFKKVPETEKKRVGLPLFNSGPTDTRPIWQPKLVYNGHEIKNAAFDAFKARWPNDHSDLSGKLIEIYLPQEGQLYPSYFPYFMQVSGMIGKAKMHIVDSGRF